MNNGYVLPTPVDFLCHNILQHNVIPVLGNELYQYAAADTLVIIESWYATRLQQEYGIDEPSLTTLTATVEYFVSEKQTNLNYIRSFLNR